jgi:hypothetical protein
LLAISRGNQKEPEHTQTLETWCFERLGWIEQDPICSAEQKGGHFWKNIFNYFHEHKHLGDHLFESDSNEKSLIKRWSFIQEQCTKVHAAYSMVLKWQVSGLGTWCGMLWATSR